MTTATSTALVLEVACPGCRSFAEPLFEQLAGGDYDECSVLDLTDFWEWSFNHRTARRRAARSEGLGYRVERFSPADYVDDVFAINTSLERRQGRPMTAGYRSRPEASPDPEWPCLRHRVNRYGVFLEETLVAYAYIYRSGQLALVSQILGHGDHLRSDVMYLLAREIIAAESRVIGGFLIYNRHDSGTPGLRFYKERVGFEAREVEWLA